MTRRRRIGFLGLGWIGRHRMAAILEAGAVDVAGFVEPSPEQAAEASLLAPFAEPLASFDDLLGRGIDGVVIATPSALHAAQSLKALRSRVAVFCQKPLGRSAQEVAGVVEAACQADRLLGVDLSYRFTNGAGRIRDLLRAGALGRIYAVDLVFHNAYGPDRPWFYDLAQSGGGCVIDLGVHLVDLALWMLDFPRTSLLSTRLFAGGEALPLPPGRVEDYAAATLETETGTIMQLACSWRLHAGCEAIISAAFHGTEGGARLRNLGGSFHDFTAERYRGTACETLAMPPDAWGGRAAVAWAARLSAGEGFDPAARHLVQVAEVLDRLYGR